MREGRKTVVICAALALGTLLLYAPVLGFDFINWDDPQYVSGNYHLRGGLGLRGLAWCFSGYSGNWVPLVWLSYMLDYRFYGLHAAGYHATNVVLHAANAALLFLVLTRMTGAMGRSAMVAALFAWHPMHVESVAWIAERKDVLSGLFWMLTILAYINYARKGGAARYCLTMLLFAFGLMAKPMVVTLPFVLVLLDWWPLRRFQSEGAAPARTWGQLILEKIPMLVLAAGSCLVTFLLQTRIGGVPSLAQESLAARLANAVVSYSRYIEKLLWPADLSVIYPLPKTWLVWDVVVAIIVLAGVTNVAVRFRQKSPYWPVGWLWFLGTLVPVIGVVQAGAQGMADRYTYIPSIGLFIIICWGAFDFLNSTVGGIKSAPTALSAAALVLCGLATSKQLQYWKDSGTVFSHALAVFPDNRVALASHGLFLYEKGELPQAIRELQKEVQLFPNDQMGHAFLGDSLYSSGQADAAAEQLRTALKLKPNFLGPRSDLVSILLDKNLPGEAAAECAIGLKYDPDDAGLHCSMGKALGMQGRLDEAREQFSEALRLNPQFPDAHYQLALVLAAKHQTAEAVAQYRMALNLEPALPDALNNLAWILATDPQSENRNGAEAVQLARRACELTGNKVPLMLGTLAAACAEAGEFDEAIADAQKAHDLAEAQGSKEVAAKNVELLKLFRSRHAYHE